MRTSAGRTRPIAVSTAARTLPGTVAAEGLSMEQGRMSQTARNGRQTPALTLNPIASLSKTKGGRSKFSLRQALYFTRPAGWLEPLVEVLWERLVSVFRHQKSRPQTSVRCPGGPDKSHL